MCPDSTHTNCNVNNGTLYYIHLDAFSVYVNKKDRSKTKVGTQKFNKDDYEYDEILSQYRYITFRDKIQQHFVKYSPLFTIDSEMVGHGRRRILMYPTLNIVLEDNDWSIAVELLYNETHVKKITDAERNVFNTIDEELRRYLLKTTSAVYTRDGSWSVSKLQNTTTP